MGSRPFKIGNVDRFSALPDEVAHEIIGFVGSEDIPRLSAVSKRCRQLCLSVPFFRVHTRTVQHSAIKRAQLMNYADRVLCLRRSEHIPVFRISWSPLSDEQQEYRVLSWLHSAVSCNAREIHLFVSKLRPASDFTLPAAALLSSESLQTLSAVILGGFADFKIPASVVALRFSSLKCLIFCHVGIGDSFSQWISSCCKSLETLELVETKGSNSIAITSSSLKLLRMRYPRTVIDLQVYAEKLEEISLILRTTHDQRQPKLVIPNIHTFHKILFSCTNNHIDLHEVRNKSFSGLSYCKRMDCLRTFSTRLTCLRMFGDSVQKLWDKRLLPIQMPNLSVLVLWTTHSNVEIVSLMASFLEGTPNLQHLTIQRDGDAYLNGGGNLEAMRHDSDLKNFPLLPMLKDVTFVLAFGVEKSRLELINYLINSARKIDVKLICTPPIPCDVYTLVKGMEKASSYATVNVLPYTVSIPDLQTLSPFGIY